MIPLRDNVPSNRTPFVNYAMIALCTLVFVAQLNEDPREGSLVERYGMIPARVLDPDREIVQTYVVERPVSRTTVRRFEESRPLAPSSVPAWLTVLTCIFLHGGWMHFLGNMWFLYIFGDNVEDRFGHVGYTLFYLATGAAASLTHLVSGPESTIPTIGASGAIAGVMGAYFLLYPKARVMAIIPIVFIIQVMVVPAPIFLGIWFLIQFFQGTFSMGAGPAAGVAWWAHVGGFVAGLAAAWLLGRGGLLNARVETVRPGSERLMGYRVGVRRPPRH